MTKPTLCESVTLGVPCARRATCRQRHGVHLRLCGWCAKQGRYQPTDKLESTPEPKPPSDVANFDIVVSTELYDRLAAFADLADSAVTKVADYFVRKALDREDLGRHVVASVCVP